MNTVIETENLCKNYNKFAALKDINLQINRGQIVGLFGPNGAGKTTLLKAILGLTDFNGKLEVLKLNPRKKHSHLMQRMCFIADVAILPPWLKAKNAVEFVDGVHPKFDKSKALDFLKRTDINLESKFRTLSKGMIVQLHLALVMAIDAEILILDEPTLGLDIIFRKTFYKNLLNDYFNEQRTIIIATHQVEEVESLLTDLIMINKGELIQRCSMNEFAEKYIQVTVKPGQVESVKKLKPISEQQQLGLTKFLFENKSKDELSQFGEISTPSISDVFVATITGE